jgi:hypothetical protein
MAQDLILIAGVLMGILAVDALETPMLRVVRTVQKVLGDRPPR